MTLTLSFFFCSVCLLFFASPVFSQAKDPLLDFCRRFGHQTAVIDRRLYIDGGLLNWNPIRQNTINYTNQNLLYHDLNNISAEGMPQLVTGLKKPSEVPDVSGGVLWADEVNKKFYLFGGEYTNDPEHFTMWQYDILNDDWSHLTDDNSIHRVSWGAGTTVNDRGEGYYLGGWLNNKTVPGWGDVPLATSMLIKYDMVENTWTNSSGPDTTGRAEGLLVYIPASDRGLLIYFGGILDVNGNGTVEGADMAIIYIYDIASSKWYSQTATGDVPEMRRKFCGGVTWADDQSSYNIYLYGGQGITNTTGFDDVYILSLPSFTWVEYFQTDPGEGNPHGMLSCNVVDGSQMLIIGGNFAQHDECDSPVVWGAHNLNLGSNGPDKAAWEEFYLNITSYDVPPELLEEIGGSASGGATNLEPESDWDSKDLEVYFTRTAKAVSRTATRDVSTSTSTENGDSEDSELNVAAVAGGTAGGAIFVLFAVGLFIWYINHKNTSSGPSPQGPPVELPANGMNELSSQPLARDTNHLNGISQHSPVHSGTPLVAQQYSPIPHTTSPVGYYISANASPNSPNSQHAGVASYPYPYDQPPNQPHWQQQHSQTPTAPYDPNLATYLSRQYHSQPHEVGTSSAGHTTPTDSTSQELPTTSNTPVHFYTQPLNIRGRPDGELGSQQMHEMPVNNPIEKTDASSIEKT